MRLIALGVCAGVSGGLAVWLFPHAPLYASYWLPGVLIGVGEGLWYGR